MKVSLLLWLILHGVTTQFTVIGDTTSNKHKAMLSVSFFGVFGIFIIITFIFQSMIMIKYRRLYLQVENKADFTIDLAARIFTAISGLLYYFGDNLSTLIRTFGSEIKCDSDCQTKYDNISTVCLLIGVIGFTLLPVFIDKSKGIVDTIKYTKERKWSWMFWRNTEHVMSLIVDIEGWFTTVADLPLKSTKYCPSIELIITWVLYGVIMLCWVAVVVLTYFPAFMILWRKKQPHRKLKMFGLIITCIMLWFCVAGFLIAENDQPIGCLYDCDVSDDGFSNEHFCKNTRYRVTRAIILLVVEIIFVVLTIGMTIDKIHVVTLFQRNKENQRLTTDQDQQSRNEYIKYSKL